MSATKVFQIPKQLVMDAFKDVKANKGAAGVDKQSIEDFELNLKDNLYKIWNRMSSGSYLPPSVKAVAIPKKNGGERILGIPTVSDRVAQMVVKMSFEPNIEAIFLQDSYGYRPGKSALDAVGVTRERCWRYDWVLEWDIKGLFDNIGHDLLLRALRKHTDCKWVLLYIERWLKAPMQMEDGTQVERNKGTPQGGVVSPCLANLFLHYTFDAWMGRNYPDVPWCRYADDGLIHCKTEQEAKSIMDALSVRFKECGLEMHPTKTKIVYCKDQRRGSDYPNTKFEFLGYCFQARGVKIPNQKMFCGFNPAVSSGALKAMRQTIRKGNFRNRADLEIDDIARMCNPVLQGWINYYGRFYRSALKPVFHHFNKTIVAWAMKKYKSLRRHRTPAKRFVEGIARRQPDLFVHWKDRAFGIHA